jgi:hypothetical protein
LAQSGGSLLVGDRASFRKVNFPDKGVLNMNCNGLFAATLSLIAINFCLETALPLLAETCTALMPVGGNNTTVIKTVSQPSIPLFGPIGINNDWNTDFIVDSNATYKNYRVTLLPSSNGEYSIRMYLKYSDSTADNFYDQKPSLTANKPLVVSGFPRSQQQPYQVNVFVGDLVSMGKGYQVTVQGCR